MGNPLEMEVYSWENHLSVVDLPLPCLLTAWVHKLDKPLTPSCQWQLVIPFLVGGGKTPLKYESVGMIVSDIWKELERHNPNVPNHQPVGHAIKIVSTTQFTFRILRHTRKLRISSLLQHQDVEDVNNAQNDTITTSIPVGSSD